MRVKTIIHFFILSFVLITITQLPAFAFSTTLSASLKDSIIIKKDSIVKSTKTQSAIESKVHYTAKDSMRMDIKNQKMYLFGDAKVTYQDLILNAGYIELDLKNNIVFAEGVKDSLGKNKQLPAFKQGAQNFSSQKMTYNFKTKKGKIIDVDTKEGEGYVHGENVKKDSNSMYYIKHGRYTTCDDPHPHFYISAQKLKVIPGDKIVTGPANLVIADIPTPLAVPFGFFPNKIGRKSGILIPAYGESVTQGFFLSGGGVYLGLSDYVDLALKGDIYSHGSWALNSLSSYNKKYKFQGNFNIGYSNFFTEDKALPTTSAKKDFFIRWTHNQDPKANPSSRFSANVNAGSSKYNKYNTNVTNQYLTNTFSSNISYSKSLGKLFNLSINARHSQNTIAKTVDLSLPEATLTMNRINPFKSKSRIIPKWYDKINLGYTGEGRNSIVGIRDSLLFKTQTLKKFQNGIKHTVPINVSFNVLKYFTLSPAITATSRWYFQSIEQKLDEAKKIVTDTVQGFKMANDINLSAVLTTNVYGNYYFKNAKVKQIRHLIIPNVNFSYRPDYGEEKYGYYKTIKDTNVKYSIFQNGIYGAPGKGKSSLINFSLANTLEMKVREKSDTSQKDKKIILLEAFNLSTSYNMAADSIKLSKIGLSARTTLFKLITINYTGTLDPYVRAWDKKVTVNKFEWNENKKLGRLSYSDLAIGTTIKSKNKTADPKKEKELQDKEYQPFNLSWSINLAYKINYNEPTAAADRKIVQSLGFGGDISPTPKWKLGFSSGYDFLNKRITYTSVNVYRDLHCWELKATVVPFGFNQRYTLDINVKSAILKDLKLSRKRDWYDYQ